VRGVYFGQVFFRKFHFKTATGERCGVLFGERAALNMGRREPLMNQAADGFVVAQARRRLSRPVQEETGQPDTLCARCTQCGPRYRRLLGQISGDAYDILEM